MSILILRIGADPISIMFPSAGTVLSRWNWDLLHGCFHLHNQMNILVVLMQTCMEELSENIV